MTKIVSIIAGIFLCFNIHITLGVILIVVPIIDTIFNNWFDEMFKNLIIDSNKKLYRLYMI